MPKRQVPDTRKTHFFKEVNKAIRNQTNLPRGYEFVSRDGKLYIRNLETEQETPIG